MKKILITMMVLLWFVQIQPIAARSQTETPPYTVQRVVSGLGNLVYVTNAHDGSNRLFVAEKVGRVMVIQNGELLETPFLDITDFVGSESFERGFFSIAFHPDYENNGWFYVAYSDRFGNIVVARYTVSAINANVANPNSLQLVLSVLHPFTSHNGGQLQFGPDGYLYVSVGDNYDDNGKLDLARNAQNPRSFLGKLLRLDVDQGLPYTVPPDNPYTFNEMLAPEIWAMGLRNPWRFSFDRETGDLIIGDVGHNVWEEVDFQAAGSAGGQNYGWSDFEGFETKTGAVATSDLTFPVMVYVHDENCAVIGGYVYRGQALPDLWGKYLFGDFCTGTVWSMIASNAEYWKKEFLLKIGSKINSFGEDEAGEIYIATYAGEVLQIVASGGGG